MGNQYSDSLENVVKICFPKTRRVCIRGIVVITTEHIELRRFLSVFPHELELPFYQPSIFDVVERENVIPDPIRTENHLAFFVGQQTFIHALLELKSFPGSV